MTIAKYLIFVLGATLGTSALAIPPARTAPTPNQCFFTNLTSIPAACQAALQNRCEQTEQCKTDPDPAGCTAGIDSTAVQSNCTGVTVPPPTAASAAPTARTAATSTSNGASELSACQSVHDNSLSGGTCDTSTSGTFNNSLSKQTDPNAIALSQDTQQSMAVNCVGAYQQCQKACGDTITQLESSAGASSNPDLQKNIAAMKKVNCSDLSQAAQTVARDANNAANNKAASMPSMPSNPSSAAATPTPLQPMQTPAPPGDGSTICGMGNIVDDNSAQCKAQAAQSQVARDGAGQRAGFEGGATATSGGGNFNVSGAENSTRQGAQLPTAGAANANAGNQADQFGAMGGMMGHGEGGGIFNPNGSNAPVNNNQPVGRGPANYGAKPPTTELREKSGSGYSERSIASVPNVAGPEMPDLSKLLRGNEMVGMRGLDLKKYLPMGARDPNGRMTGVSVNHPDIRNQYENLFAIVSNRIQIHCKLQQLYGCR